MRKPLALAVLLPLALAPVVASSPAQAQDIVNQTKLEKNIRKGLAVKGIKVTVKCPKNVTWKKGKTFYCKVVDTQGTKGKVTVTIKSKAKAGKLTWVY